MQVYDVGVISVQFAFLSQVFLRQENGSWYSLIYNSVPPTEKLNLFVMVSTKVLHAA